MQVNVLNISEMEFPDSITGVELAKKVKKEINGPALCLKINGELKDLTTTIQNGDEVEVMTFDTPEGKDLFWHSSAHLMAQAVLRLYPDAQPTIGPSIENGFYYDFANLQVSEDDFGKIEDEMKKIVKERAVPERIEYTSKDEALAVFGDNPFKTEMIENLEEGLSAYQQGDFIDLCRGPHVPNIGLIQSFKLMKTSGAYWRADAEKAQLTRVYGISFPDKKQLKEYLFVLEEAKKRDHRVLGKKLDLFSFHEEAAGMPFFHPNGMVLWNELMKFWRECHDRANYVEIKTPVMMTRELWETSGHWANYRENMYVSEIDDREFAIKPMNCPGGMLFYKEAQYSYRQLPYRVGEIGNVHRHELSGALSGLFRVRSFHQDDAHIFMKPSDIASEVLGVLKLADEMYAQFGLTYHLELSTKPAKAIGSDEQWEIATNGLKDALESTGYDYMINEGDGAFYGPKIDVHVKDAIGRTWQCATIQLDMMLPERFDLTYDAADGSKQRPVMIHRVIYGSIERFFGILVEHYAGRFPLWMSPRQIRVLPVADRHVEYADKLRAQFFEAGLRAEVDDSAESISKKVRNAQLGQVNYILVVGDRELEAETVTVRTRANQVLGEKAPQELIEALTEEYKTRASESTLS